MVRIFSRIVDSTPLFQIVPFQIFRGSTGIRLHLLQMGNPRHKNGDDTPRETEQISG